MITSLPNTSCGHLFRYGFAMVLSLFGLMPAAGAEQPVKVRLEAEPQPLYDLSWKSDFNNGLVDTQVTFVNGIPNRVHQLVNNGGGGSSLSRWIERGQNRIEFMGPRVRSMFIRIVERNLVGTVPQFHRELARVNLVPDEASKPIIFQADVSWSPIGAATLDLSHRGRNRAVHEIRQILYRYNAIMRSGDEHAIQEFARELFLPGAMREFETSYQSKEYPRKDLPKLALDWAVRRHCGIPERFEKESLRFVFGTRGILVYRGFDEMGSAYLYRYREEEDDDEIRRADPWVFLWCKEKWLVYDAETL